MKTSRHLKRRLTFGKHKGQTLAHVASFDPTYLDWMRANGLCDIEVIHARDRGEFVNERRKLRDGHAIVWTGGLLTHLNGQSFHPGIRARVRV